MLNAIQWTSLATVCFAALPAHAQQAYVVDAAASTFVISVGKSGLFSFAGHSHEVLAGSFEGRVVADEAELGKSSVSLKFEMAKLQVSAKDEPAEDLPKVQEKMAGAEVLDVTRFPTATFESTSVEGRQSPDGSWNLKLTGNLTLRDKTQSIVLPMRLQKTDGVLTATGQVVLKQTDFGISPVSVAGVVKVKNELGVDYKIVARPAP
jgi:polyisoprenoid-binding protein YceI